MNKRLLSVLVALALVIALMVPISVPVLAAAPTVTSLSPDYTSHALDGGSETVTFTGSGFNVSTPSIVFADPDVTASDIVVVNDTTMTATVTVDPGTTRGPKSVTVTTTDGSATLYSAYLVVSLPSPEGVSGSNVALEINPCSDAAGLNLITTAVEPGDTVYYKITLSVSDTSYNYMAGQLAVQFPDHSDYIKVAGYGAETPLNPQIPEVTFGNTFVVVCPTPYIVDAADLEEYPSGSDIWVLVASAAYGSYTDSQGRTYLNITQNPGRQETNSALLNCTAFIQGPLAMFGSLEVTKVLDLNGASGIGATENFILRVYGPSYPYPGTTHTVHVVNGVINPSSDSPWVLDELVPGTYTVTEDTPGASWSKSSSVDVTVYSGEPSYATVTNDFIPGHLEVTKVLDLNGAGPSGITKNFTLTVTGPSFPSGTSHTIHVVNGVINPSTDSPWVLDNVTPGAYTVTETTPGSPWSATGGGGVTVNPGTTAYSTVTNDFIPGSLEVTKFVELNDLVGTGIDQDFTITVTGPSYPGGTSHVFNCIDGVIVSSAGHENPWVLEDLIPGAYYVVESDPGSLWSVSYFHGNVTVYSGSEATASVTNEYGVPHTTLLTITADPISLPREGDYVTVTVTDINDGDIPITDVYFEISSVPPFAGSPDIMTYIEDDGNGDAIMDPGETWTFAYTVFVSEPTLFTVVGHGMAGGIDVTGPSEIGTVRVNIPPVPASSTLTIGILVLGLAGAAAFVAIRRRKQSHQ